MEIKEYTYQLQPPIYENNNNGLEILPNNFEKIVKENTLPVEKVHIINILNEGYTLLEKESDFNISSDTPLLLTTENITAYVLSNLSIEDRNIQSKIDSERKKILLDLKYKSLFLLPFLNSEERNTVLDIYRGDISLEQIQNEEVLKKILNLSENREKYISLTQLKDIFILNNEEKKIWC